jgi:hypothetical protein
MDLTYVVVFAILLVGAVVTGLGTYVWRKWVQPWLVARDLEVEAGIVVNAVEAILGRYTGEEKWRLALEKMKEFGWNIDAERVIYSLKAAWQALDLKQIQAGIKPPHPDGSPEVIE